MNRDDDPWAAFIGRLGEAEMGPSSSGLGQLFCYPFEAADKKMSSTDLHTLQDWMNSWGDKIDQRGSRPGDYYLERICKADGYVLGNLRISKRMLG